MNARFFAHRPRRQLLAAGVLFWTTLALTSAADITLKDLRVACVATAPTPTYTVEMTVVNGMDCPMAWITFHSSATFSPHIINLNTYVASGGEANVVTTLTGPAPGSTHSLVLLSHCLRDGEICNPCRLEIKLDLPTCDPTVDPPNPRPERPRPVRAFGLQKDRFFLSLPKVEDETTPTRFVVEASEDMVVWNVVASSASPDGQPSMASVDSDRTVWVPKDKTKHCLFYRVREVPAE